MESVKDVLPDLDYIAPPLRPLAVPIDDLTPDPRNARKHDDQNLSAIKKSLSAFGQRKPVVALKNGIVIAGNGTLKAAQELGWTHLAVVATEDDEHTATAYAIADNRTADLSEFDPRKLSRLLDELEQEAEPLLAAVGYSQIQIARLIEAYSDEEDPPDDDTDKGDDQGVGTRHVKLVYATPDHERFSEALETLSLHYGTTNAEDTVLTALESLASSVQAKGRKGARIQDVGERQGRKKG